MSFEVNISNFLAINQLTNKIRRKLIGAPSQFKKISNKVRNLSIAIQDADIVISECEPDAKQKTDLQEITSNCHKILSHLETTLDKYEKIQLYGGNLDKKAKRVWKKFEGEPEDIRELEDRITLNVKLLNTFIGHISAQAAFRANKDVDRLEEHQDGQEQFGIFDSTTSYPTYFFQTPAITSFKYKPISLEGPAFRLLRLFKGGGDLIEGQLFDSKLPPPDLNYAALSYTWGSEFRPCEITINERKMKVTKNAYLALRDLRHHEKDRILWIDTLCIDQSNNKERGEQVQQMGSIYSNAERVIIWLGEATYDINCIMHYMRQLEKEFTKHSSNDQKISITELGSAWLAGAHSLTDDQRGHLVEGLWSLLRQNWFKRVWIIQEVANARAAEIICGGEPVSTSIFALMISLLKVTPDHHCQAILDIMPGSLRDSSWWATNPDLYTLLVKFRRSEATDPLDSIYALLGISSDACDTDFPKANYERTIQDVIFDTVLFILGFNKLSSPTCRLFDWSLPEFLGNLDFLANEVLKCAIMKGDKASLKLLIVRDDVDVNIQVKTGYLIYQTPLLWAAEQGHEELVRVILRKGAQTEISNGLFQTPLMVAVENGHERIVRLLKEHEAAIKEGGAKQ